MEIKDVENLAELAKLELPESEKDSILKDMQGIVEYVKVIEQVEVGDSHPEYTQKNIWREDEPRKKGEGYDAYPKDLLTKQFPESRDGFLKVKKIL